MKKNKAIMVALFTAFAFMASLIQAVGAFFSQVRISFKKGAVACLSAVRWLVLATGAASAAPVTLDDSAVWRIWCMTMQPMSSPPCRRLTGVGTIFAVFLGVFTMTLFLVTLRKTSMGGKKTT